MRPIYLFIYLFLFLSACRDNNNTNNFFEYYPDGKLKREYFIDSLGKIQGESITYHPEGGVYIIENYQNGFRIGKYEMFYKNGQLHNYAIIDGTGETMYVVLYNEEGDVIKEEGVIFSPNIYSSLPSQAIPIGVKMLVNVSVTTVPNAVTKGEIYLLNETDKIEYKKNLVIDKNNIASFSYVFKKEGTYKMKLLGKIYDKNKLLKKDTLLMELHVIDDGSVSE